MRNVLVFAQYEGLSGASTVTPVVDGVSLIDHAKTAGVTGVDGLVPSFFDYGRLQDYFKGVGDFTCRPGLPDHVAVLVCRCGNLECNDLLARIRKDGDLVRWDDFRAQDGSLSLPDLGPFEFDRRQYEAAVAALAT
ncbi:MAG: hypothetical protein ACK4RV_00085 [Caulobacter sp.]